MIDHDELVAILIAEFPSLEEEITDECCIGALHLQVAEFATYTQHAIDASDEPTLTHCFTVAKRAYLEGDKEVQAAFSSAFLENLYFVDGQYPRAWAFKLLPEPLLTDYQDLETQFE